MELTVATAESCTGGLLAGALTDVPGSSAFYLGSVVAYDNRIKTALLGVAQATLDVHGAVSAEVALEMARRGREQIAADICIAVTGIAGPSGETPGKPVGTTFIALADGANDEVRSFAFRGDRGENRASSVREALLLLVENLEARESNAAFDAAGARVAGS